MMALTCRLAAASIGEPRHPATAATERDDPRQVQKSVLRFATTTPPIPLTVDFWDAKRKKRRQFCVSRRFATPDDARHSPTLADACRRLRTLGEHKRNDFCSPPGLWTPTSKREPFCYAFRNNLKMFRSRFATHPPPPPPKKNFRVTSAWFNWRRPFIHDVPYSLSAYEARKTSSENRAFAFHAVCPHHGRFHMVLARACCLKMLGLLNLMAEPRHNPPACPDMSSRLKRVNSHGDRRGSARETQIYCHFWIRLAFSRPKSAVTFGLIFRQRRVTTEEEREAYGSHALRFLNVGHGVRFRFKVIEWISWSVVDQNHSRRMH